jgi:hypothetical protein
MKSNLDQAPRFVWKPDDLAAAAPADARRLWALLPTDVRDDLEAQGWVDGKPPEPEPAKPT